MKRKSFNNPWEEQGGYTQMKAEKLQNQFQNESNIHRKSNIFKNVSIWVNGYTYPSSDELKRLVGENGGRYQHYFSKTHVTHVIATNLTNSKIKDLKKNDLVVHPDWIVDCVDAGKLLPVDKYLLYSTNKRDGIELKFNFDASKPPHLQSSVSGVVPKTGQSLEMSECVPHLSKHDYSKNELKKLSCRAGDTNFISEYYSHSRLHHLSMWKAELKKFTADIQKKKKFKEESYEKKFNRLIMHVDMDSFFVSVAQTIDQSLKGKAVAVCHANKSNGSSDSYSSIASCSYEARCFGLKNGMMLNKAKSLCPNLICVPYHFDQYRKVSQKVYEILSSYTCEIEAVSCDEALLDVTRIADDVYGLAENIRRDIFEETKCTASCGIAENVLLAKLATKQAKPDGVCYIQKSDVPEFIASQKVCNLPGIGASYSEKLSSLSVTNCGDLQKFSLIFLKKEFGQKLGETLYNFCRGEDSRPLKLDEERKSVSAEINYGMRFSSIKEVEEFIEQLSRQVEMRLTEAEKKGKLITLKMMVRQKGEGVPLKYMGHGLCDNASKSIMIPTPTNSAKLISRYCLQLLQLFTVNAQDIRGIGIQVTKLSNSIIQNETVNLFKYMNPSKDLNNSNGQVLQDNVLINSNGQVLQDNVLINSNGQVLQDNVPNNCNGQVLQDHSNDSLQIFQNAVQNTTCTEQNASNILSSPDLFEPTSFFESPSNKNEKESESDSWNLSVLNQLPIDIRQELQLQRETKNLFPNIKMGNTTFLEKLSYQKSPTKKSPSKKEKVHTKRTNQISPDKKIGKGRRGRPKKTLIDSSKYRDIKTSSLKIDKRILPPLNLDIGTINVDIDTLNELPEEIRNEILAEINKKISSKDKKVQSEDEISQGKKLSNQISFLALQKPPVVTPAIIQTVPSKISTSSLSLETSVLHKQLQMQQGSILKPVISLPTQNDFNDVLLSPSQINKSFMEALPEDIQSELLLEIKNARNNKCNGNMKPKENETFLGLKEATTRDCNTPLYAPTLDAPLYTPLISLNKKVITCDGKNSFDVLSPSQLDISVFNELPVELQREVMMAARSNKNKNIRFIERQRLLDNGQTTLKKDVTFGVKLTQVIPVFSGLSTSSLSTSSEITKSISEIKTFFQSWVLSGVEPNAKDVKAIKSYNHLLIKSYNMETLQLLLLYFRRLVSKKTTHSNWISVFNEVLSDTQQLMKLKYNGKLNIPQLSWDDDDFNVN